MEVTKSSPQLYQRTKIGDGKLWLELVLPEDLKKINYMLDKEEKHAIYTLQGELYTGKRKDTPLLWVKEMVEDKEFWACSLPIERKGGIFSYFLWSNTKTSGGAKQQKNPYFLTDGRIDSIAVSFLLSSKPPWIPVTIPFKQRYTDKAG